MAVMKSSIDWQIHKYRIDKCRVVIGKEKTEIHNGMIHNFFIEKDYDNDHFPAFVMTLSINAELYHAITQAQDAAIMQLDIQNVIDKGDGVYEGQKTYITDNFAIYPLDNTPFMNEESMQAMKESPAYGEGDVVPNDYLNYYTFILSRKTDLDNSKKIVNNILTSSDILDALAFTFSQAGCTNILIAQPDNTVKYSELTLLPIPLVNQLVYLNSYYGIYKEGAQIFFDYDRTYCIRKSTNCTAYETTEIKDVDIYVYDNSKGLQMSLGSATKALTKKGYISIGIDSLQVQDYSTTGSQYSGNNSLIINNAGSTLIAISSPTSGNSSTFNIITTSTHNTFYDAEQSMRLYEQGSVVTINISDLDLSLLAPNRVYRMVSSSTRAAEAIKYRYRLASVKTAFVKDGQVFSAVSEVEFRKSDFI